MGHWNGPLGQDKPGRINVNPLLSATVAHKVAELDLSVRATERLHFEVLWRTAPELLTVPFLGPERSTWQYPFGSLVRTGARIAMGSDWAVSSANPVWGIHVAVNRKAPAEYAYGHEAEAPFLPDERLDVGTALDGYTINTAFVNHLDATTGSIEVGKDADLVVLDRDLLSIPPAELSSATVQLTLVGGERVYAAGDLA